MNWSNKKKNIGLRLILIFAFAFTFWLPATYSKDIEQGPDAKPNQQAANSPIYYNRGAGRELCQEIYKLFFLPKNKNYLYSPEQLKAMSVDGKQREWRTEKPLFIPKTKEFKNFVEPIWKDVDNETAWRQLPEFLHSLQKRSEVKGEPIELGKDYKIQKTQIDLNLDESPETIYRSVSLDGGSLEVKGSVTNFVSVHFSKHGLPVYPGLLLKGQIILYKNMPAFLTRERDLATLKVMPTLENDKILSTVKPPRKFEPSGCTFSSTDNRNIGD